MIINDEPNNYINSETSDSDDISDEDTIINIPESKLCRICFESEEEEGNILIYPCFCNGSSKFIHEKCLQHWREMNYNNDAFYRCRECRAHYKIRFKYPLEKFKFSIETIHYISKISNYVALNFIFFLLGFSIRIIDKYSGFLCLKNLYGITPSKPFLDFVQKDNFYGSIFYFSYIVSFAIFFSYIWFLFFINSNIFNHDKYWAKMWYIYSFFFIFSMHFYYLFYIFMYDNYSGSESFINLEFIMSSLSFFPFFYLFKFHNQIYYILNKNNPSRVLNYHIEV